MIGSGGRRVATVRRTLLLMIVTSLTAVAATANAADAKTYLVLKHSINGSGNPLNFKPTQLALATELYGWEGAVQSVSWTGWGSNTARGTGVIRNMERELVARVTLTASDVGPLSNYMCPPPTPRFVASRYHSLRVQIHWLPDPGYAQEDNRESRALSGNLAGAPPLQC